MGFLRQGFIEDETQVLGGGFLGNGLGAPENWGIYVEGFRVVEADGA